MLIMVTVMSSVIIIRDGDNHQAEERMSVNDTLMFNDQTFLMKRRFSENHETSVNMFNFVIKLK